MLRPPSRKGRGALSNQDSRFDAFTHERFDDGWAAGEEEPPPLPTTLIVDNSKSAITRNESPDVPFEQSINPYRGCEHGCAYCYARPSHAYLGFSPGLDFETRITYKPEVAKLLRAELAAPGYRCRLIALGTNTDCYQPVERKLRLTRGILELLHECRHPVSIVTKSALVERDLDLLADMARDRLAQVFVSVTTLDSGLARRLEPRAAAPARRIETIAAIARAGVPVGVLFAPLIPVLNDHEMEAVLEAAAAAGASRAGYILLRLPRELETLFQEWLAAHATGRATHVMSLMRQLHGGCANDPRFGTRMHGEGDLAQIYARRFELARRRVGLAGRSDEPDTSKFVPPAPETEQLDLFDGPQPPRKAG